MARTKVTNSRDEFKEIMKRITRAQSFVKGWRTNIEKWRKLYDMKHYDKRRRAHEVSYSDPTFTNTVDLAVGIMLGNELRWHSYGFSPSKKEQKDTGKIEKLINGILESNVERAEEHLLYQLFLNFDRDGGGIIYSVFDPILTENRAQTEIPDPESPTGTSLKWKLYDVPIQMSVIDPLSFFCLPGGPKRWLMMGTEEMRSVLDVEMEYGVKIDKFSGRDEEVKSSLMGKFINVWDYTWIVDMDEFGVEIGKHPAVRNTVIFEGQNIRGPMIMDGYDDLPFTVQFFKPVGKESDQWHNIMAPLESSVALLERSFNRRAYQIDVYSGLPLIIKTQPGRKVTVDPGLYNSVNISPDEEITFPVWPGSAPDVQMQLDFLRSRIQQSGFSDVMFGSGSSQIAGYAISQLGDQNRIRLEQPIQHLQLLMTTWAKKSLKLLNRFAPNTIICVYGKLKGSNYSAEVDISDLSGYSIRAEIRPRFPNEETRRVAMSSQVKGTLSEYTIMERYLDVEQPEDEEERRIIEATTRHPLAIQYALMKQFAKRAKAGDEVAAMVLQSMQNQGPPGQEGRPKEPNKPEQFSGMPSPTGELTSQEQGGEPVGQSAIDQQNAMANEAPGLL